MSRLCHAALLALTLIAPAAQASDSAEAGTWMPDLGPAMERASAEGKDLLVDFTGSDWCGWCIKLHDEVFGEEEFLTWAEERYVLVALDFPRKPGSEGSLAMTPELRMRNEAESSAFAVEGFPTVLLMTADGVAYGRTGYQPGGASAYIEHLDQLESQGSKVELANAAKLIKVLGDDDKQAELDAIYTLMGKVISRRQQPLIAGLRQLDPEDKKLVLAKHALDGFMKKHLAVQEEPDWDVVAVALDKLPESTPTVERLAPFYFYRGMIALNRGDFEVVEASLASMDDAEEAQPGARDYLVQALAAAKSESES